MSHKQLVEDGWFNQFGTVFLRESYSWVSKLGIKAEKIANFGCWTGDEPFVLLWIFDASEIAVVEIKDEYLKQFEERVEKLRGDRCLHGRSITPILADMTLPVPNLPSAYYDLAFCDNVLYNMKLNQPDFAKVQSSIDEMARVIRPGGHIVVYEPQMGVEYEKLETPLGSEYIALNSASDISELFVKAGLVKSVVDLPSSNVYVYLKHH